MNAPGPGEADAVTALGWTEVDMSGVMKRPCYAFQRGNILFTTIPPARDDHQTERARRASECTSTCSVNVANTVQTSPKALGLQPGTDFCEVCCGIRSPSFSRRAHSFTTHFCTRVQAKRNASVSSSSLSDQRAKSTDSAGTSTSTSSMVNQCRNLTKNQGHVSRLSTFLQARCAGNVNSVNVDRVSSESDDASTGSRCTESTTPVAGRYVGTGTGGRPVACDKCGGAPPSSSRVLRSAKSSNVTVRSSELCSSYSSSYPSSCSSYLPFFLDRSFDSQSTESAATFSSTCCNCSADSCLTGSSSLENLRLDESSSCFSCDDESVRSWRRLKPHAGRGVRRLRNVFSSNDDSSTESDDDTGGSEMGWSFGSFWEVRSAKSSSKDAESCSGDSKPRKSGSFGRGITPFVTNSNRTMDVLEKFGTIVGSLRKPGHHVGPSKNADCLCDNCRTFFAGK